MSSLTVKYEEDDKWGEGSANPEQTCTSRSSLFGSWTASGQCFLFLEPNNCSFRLESRELVRSACLN